MRFVEGKLFGHIEGYLEGAIFKCNDGTFARVKETGAENNNIQMDGCRKFHPKTYTVQCFPIYTLLLALGMLDVDFFSLDTEGAELSILRNLPFDKIHIKVRKGKLPFTA